MLKKQGENLVKKIKALWSYISSLLKVLAIIYVFVGSSYAIGNIPEPRNPIELKIGIGMAVWIVITIFRFISKFFEECMEQTSLEVSNDSENNTSWKWVNREFFFIKILAVILSSGFTGYLLAQFEIALIPTNWLLQISEVYHHYLQGLVITAIVVAVVEVIKFIDGKFSNL